MSNHHRFITGIALLLAGVLSFLFHVKCMRFPTAISTAISLFLQVSPRARAPPGALHPAWQAAPEQYRNQEMDAC